jgi:hypothetical protein
MLAIRVWARRLAFFGVVAFAVWWGWPELTSIETWLAPVFGIPRWFFVLIMLIMFWVNYAHSRVEGCEERLLKLEAKLDIGEGADWANRRAQMIKELAAGFEKKGHSAETSLAMAAQVIDNIVAGLEKQGYSAEMSLLSAKVALEQLGRLPRDSPAGEPAALEQLKSVLVDVSES